MKRAPQSRRGAVLVLAAACLVLIFSFVAFTVDIGYIALVRGQLQNAADASALAGAQALDDGPAEAVTAAIAIAAQNEAGQQPVALLASDVEVGRWDEDTATFIPLAGADLSEADAVRVTCYRSAERGTALSLFFAPVIRIFQADVRTSAVARKKSPKCGGIFGDVGVSLQGSILTDSYNSSLGPYGRRSPGEEGHVCSNGSLRLGGASRIHGNAHPGPDGEVIGSARVTGEIKPLPSPIPIPPFNAGNAATVNDNDKIPLTDGGAQPLNANGEFEVSGSDSINLPPGTYYFSQMTIGGSAQVHINGPTTIYVTGDVVMQGSGMVNNTQIPSQQKLFVNGTTCSVKGSADWYGLVYAPNARVEVQGAADYYGMVVGRELVLQGGRNGGIHVDEALTREFNFSPRRTVLVQ